MTWWKRKDGFWTVWDHLQHSPILDETSEEERDFEDQVNQEVEERRRNRSRRRPQECIPPTAPSLEPAAYEVALSSSAKQRQAELHPAMAEASRSEEQPLGRLASAPSPALLSPPIAHGTTNDATQTFASKDAANPVSDRSTSNRSSPVVGGLSTARDESMSHTVDDSVYSEASAQCSRPARAQPAARPSAPLLSFRDSHIIQTSTPQALRATDSTAQEVATPEDTPQAPTAALLVPAETPVRKILVPQNRRLQVIDTPEQVSSPINTPIDTPTPERPGAIGKRKRLNAGTPVLRGKQQSTSSRSLQQSDGGAAEGEAKKGQMKKGQTKKGKGRQAIEKPETSQIFKDLVFFYADARKKLRQERCGIIHDHGGTHIDQADDTITHVIFEGKARGTLKGFLKISSLDDLPEGTEVVNWNWLALCIETGRLQPINPHVHRSFPQPRRSSRSDTESEPEESLPKKKARDSLGFTARIRHAEQVAKGTFGSSKPRPVEPQSAGSSGRGVHDVNTVHGMTSDAGVGWKKEKQGGTDGLDEVIEGVKEGSLLDAEESDEESAVQIASNDHDADEDDSNPNPLADRFMFGRKNDKAGKNGPNEFLARKFEELHELYEGQPGKNAFSIRTYQQAAATMRRITIPITSGKQAKSIKGIGDSLAERIDEFLSGNTGRADYEDNEQARCTRLFKGVYGVGRQMAYSLYQQGARTIADLRTGKYPLTPGQLIGLDLYDDLNTRIPRSECKQLYDLIQEEAMGIDDKLWVEIMGSYRRGQEDSGDVDILITRDDGDGVTHAGVLRKLVGRLKKKGIITHDLSEPGDWHAVESKWMGVGRVHSEGKFRRIDILCIPFESWGASLIYFTGNELFNRSLRLYARKLGFSLNQRGLYKGVVRGRDGIKTVAGDLIASKTEEEIFDILGVRWRHPHHRKP
ncbi:hypothetical protein L202_07925 [Cryptococcus amylolentus CBS 6039]|uniref:DNA polymerase lambda n=2 Tax=Cryptococcus amylolentus TaxID=104669 RepID=A0A1E3HAM7_9TREE|nr:hypothetical protein L202_07925 [Cryptococcus amylolentus CBS 6039]ODN73397.1 hypothetical protein L202_07925 [Cryptococcus amylolentus CBS 6039]ODN99172.1 hypothetical protein I350_07331 [Cryptococcus amylolentus CBS 6273]